MHSSKAQARLEKDMAPAFQDQVVMIATKDLCRSLFDKPGPRELSREQMKKLLGQLRYRFGSNIEQLARITGYSYKELSKIIDEP